MLLLLVLFLAGTTMAFAIEPGREGQSPGSDRFLSQAALNAQSMVAFLPLENLSGVEAPLVEIGARYAAMLRDYGLKLLEQERLDAFMHRHRMRYTGGIGRKIARALQEEEGVNAVVITSLESYYDGPAPVIALTSRLVICQEMPRIVWIDGVGLTGLDAPGLLGLGKVTDISRLEKRALTSLLDSLDDFMSGNRDRTSAGAYGPEPADHYRATGFKTTDSYRVAVVPFLNRHARKNAGFVVPLHLVRTLHRYENLEIVEPGVVRETLLKYRLIMKAGPSLAITDVLTSESGLGADLILSGYVFDYQDHEGIPKIDFATRIFHGPERKVVWWSRSYATGDDGVLFFDFGRERSTHQLMEQMAQAVGGLLLE